MLPVPASLWWPLLILPSTGDGSTLADNFSSVSWGVTAPFFRSWCVQDFVCALQEWSLCFSQSCGSPIVTYRWPSRWGFCGDSQSLCWIPRLESLMWGSEPSQQWDNFFAIIVLQSVDCPPGGYGIWFYLEWASPTISLQFLLFLLIEVLCFFWWILVSFCHWLLNNKLQFLMPLQEEMSACASTLPSLTRSLFFWLLPFKYCLATGCVLKFKDISFQDRIQLRYLISGNDLVFSIKE